MLALLSFRYDLFACALKCCFLVRRIRIRFRKRGPGEWTRARRGVGWAWNAREKKRLLASIGCRRRLGARRVPVVVRGMRVVGGKEVEWGFGQMMMGKGGDDDDDVRPSVSPSVVVVVVDRWRRLSFSLRALSCRER